MKTETKHYKLQYLANREKYLKLTEIGLLGGKLEHKRTRVIPRGII